MNRDDLGLQMKFLQNQWKRQGSRLGTLEAVAFHSIVSLGQEMMKVEM